MEEEVWKPIPGYEEMYEVSNMGRVKSVFAYKCKDATGIRKFMKTKKGYLKVKLKRNQICVHKLVHRLVATVFIPNPENKPSINHKKGVKTDNRASELEWCTTKENNDHAVRIGLNNASDFVGPTAHPILDTLTGITYLSKARACKALRISNDTVNEIISGRKKGALIKL